jgi:hypothetical protein
VFHRYRELFVAHAGRAFAMAPAMATVFGELRRPVPVLSSTDQVYPIEVTASRFILLLLALAAGAFAQPTQLPPNDPGARIGAKQPKADPKTDRTIRGVVRNDNEDLVAGAVVTLENKNTKSVIKSVSGTDGGFLFDGLKKGIDYSIKAEYKGAATTPRTISSLDSRQKLYLELKLPAPPPPDPAKKKGS